jgi:hypothetical protein
VTEPWAEYQENAAAYFRSLGLDAVTNARVTGVRTNHEIDVLVRSHHVGFAITWLVECKNWKTPVTKLHVLALREIVADVGADRGILLCEVGFQSGAREAANLTNVQLTSIKEMQVVASDTILSMRMRELFDRVSINRDRYWAISKDERITNGFRYEVGEPGFSAINCIELCATMLTHAFRGVYPFKLETIEAFVRFGPDKEFKNAAEVVGFTESAMTELDKKFADYARGRVS